MRNRRGVGLFFIIIITLIVIVAFAGFFQMTFSRQVVDRVSDVSLGEMALLLAESAVSEASFRVRKEVNTPGTNSFSILRQEVYGNSSGAVELDVDVPQVKNLFSKKVYSRFSLDEVKAEIVYQKQFSTIPYEKNGILNCRATVSTRTGLTQKVVRTVNRMFEFKVHLTAPPRPFDQVTFFLVNAEPVVSSANYKIGEVISEYQRLAKERYEFVSLLEGEKGNVPNFDFDQAIAKLNAVNIPSRVSVENRIHEFKTPLTVFTVKNTVSLEKINLPDKMKQAERAIKESLGLYEAARSSLSANAANVSALDEYLTALKALVLAYDEIVVAVDDFQDYFAEYSGSAREQLEGFFPKLSESEWRRKAGWYISSSRGSVTAQLKTLLKEQGPLSGVIFIDNEEDVLSLEDTGAVQAGNLVIVTTGNVRLSSATSSWGLTTIVSYGTVFVEGTFSGSVVACDRLSIPGDSVIAGNLVMNEIKDFSSVIGTVKRDARLHSGRTVPGDPSGAYTDYYFVSISPCDTFQILERK